MISLKFGNEKSFKKCSLFNILIRVISMSLISCVTKPISQNLQYTDKNRIYPLALQGNLKPVFDEFKTSSEATLTPEYLALKNEYLK